jgi:hypothetical protein
MGRKWTLRTDATDNTQILVKRGRLWMRQTSSSDAGREPAVCLTALNFALNS